MLVKVTTILLVIACVAKATPVDNEQRKPIVIDIPAGPPPSSEDEDALAPSAQIDDNKKSTKESEVTKGEDGKPVTDVETIPLDSSSDEVNDFKPTFVIIRTRPFFSSSFGSPHSSIFGSGSPFGSGGSSFFGNSPFKFNNPMSPNNPNNKDGEQASSGSDSTEAVAPGPFFRPSTFNVDDLMTRLQQQMSSLWGTLLNPQNRPRPSYPFRPFAQPFNPFDSSNEDTTNNTSATSSEEVFNINKLPANYSNSTSETKVIDGNVVQVNRTIHKISSGNNTRGFFQFQVINVQPQTTSTTEKVGANPEEEVHLEPEASIVDTEKHEIFTDPTTTKGTSPTPEADPTLNEVEEKKYGGIDHGLL